MEIGEANPFHIMTRTMTAAFYFLSLKWHYEVFRWFDLFVGKDDVDTEVQVAQVKN